MEGRAQFTVDIETLDDRTLVRVTGELDMATARTFDDALLAVSDGADVVVDLSPCTFVDSTGMRSIVALARRAETVAVVASDPAVVRALEITSLDTVVAVHASLDEAR